MILAPVVQTNVVFYVANKYSIHAEQNCIRKCKNKAIIRHCTLILVTVSGNNKLKYCEPCHMCAHIIKKYKVRKVINYHNVIN